MSYPLENMSQLQPIVRQAVTSLYGKTSKNITIQEAGRIPPFKEPKHSWQVNVLFNLEEYKYTVQFEIRIIDGLITKVHVIHRDPIKTDKN